MPVIPDLAVPLTDGDVAVRLFAERDIPEILIAYQDDPHLHAAVGLERPPTGAQLGRESESAPADRAAGAHVRFTVVQTGSDVCRGRISAHHFDWDHRRTELAMWLAPQVRGRGWAPRVLRLVTGWLFAACGIERAELLIDPDNAPMLQTAAATGFHREGVFRAYVRYERRRLDMVVLSLLPTDPVAT